jgi:hypothetical protein
VPKGATESTPGLFHKFLGEFLQVAAGDRIGPQVRFRHDVDRAAREQHAVSDIRDFARTKGGVGGRISTVQPAKDCRDTVTVDVLCPKGFRQKLEAIHVKPMSVV